MSPEELAGSCAVVKVVGDLRGLVAGRERWDWGGDHIVFG